MIKTYKIGQRPTSEQAQYFARAAGTARFVFNWALSEWKAHYEEEGNRPHARSKSSSTLFGTSNFPGRMRCRNR
jgi:putative transposase